MLIFTGLKSRASIAYESLPDEVKLILLRNFLAEVGAVVIHGDIIAHVAALANLFLCFAGAGQEGTAAEEESGNAAVVEGEEVVLAGHGGNQCPESADKAGGAVARDGIIRNVLGLGLLRQVDVVLQELAGTLRLDVQGVDA